MHFIFFTRQKKWSIFIFSMQSFLENFWDLFIFFTGSNPSQNTKIEKTKVFWHRKVPVKVKNLTKSSAVLSFCEKKLKCKNIMKKKLGSLKTRKNVYSLLKCLLTPKRSGSKKKYPTFLPLQKVLANFSQVLISTFCYKFYKSFYFTEKKCQQNLNLHYYNWHSNVFLQ